MVPDHERELLNALENVRPQPRVLSSVDADITATRGSVTPEHQEHTTEAPAPPAKVTQQNLWRHPDAHPIALDAAMVRRYGAEWLGWEAETLRVLIPEDFKTPSVSELNIAKLQACKTLHLVDDFWARWEVFSACLMPFNSEFPDFRTMPVPTVAQCLVAVDIAGRIREEAWSDEMKAYFRTVYAHDGIFLPLPPIDFVTLEVPEEVDHAALEKRWPDVRATGRAPKGETVLDEQLRRLLAANGYLEESRARLQQQLHA